MATKKMGIGHPMFMVPTTEQVQDAVKFVADRDGVSVEQILDDCIRAGIPDAIEKFKRKSSVQPSPAPGEKAKGSDGGK